MQANPPYTLIYIASVTAGPSRKKAVRELKQLQGDIQALSHTDNPDNHIQVVVEGKEGNPYGYELLKAQSEAVSIQIVHLLADSSIQDRWFLNAASGNRKALEGEAIQFDQCPALQLVILDGGASMMAVEQLLFTGIPQVLAIARRDDKSQTQAFLSNLYQALLNGATFRNAFEGARDNYPGELRFQEIPSDPFQYWNIKEEWEQHRTFPEGLYYLSHTQEILDRNLESQPLAGNQKSGTSEKPPSLYYCTQELRGQSNSWSFVDIRQEEMATITVNSVVWQALFPAAPKTETVSVPEPYREDIDPVEETPQAEELVYRAVSENGHALLSGVLREENKGEWVDELMTQYRRRFTLTLPKTHRKALAGVSMAAILVLLFAIFTWKQFDWKNEVIAATQTELRPQGIAFASQENFNILLLPFRSYAGCNQAEHPMETAVRDRLNQIRESDELGIRVAFFNHGRCPETEEEARKLARENKADLVIWGNYRQPAYLDDAVHLRFASLEDRYREVSIWLGQDVGKQALSEDLNRGQFTGYTEDIVYWILGLSHLHDESYQSALSYLHQIELGDFKAHSIVHHMIAKCYQGLRLDEQALEAYNEAICLNPQNAEAYHSRGRYYQTKRRIDLALHDYETVLQLVPQHHKANMLANMLTETYQEGKAPITVGPPVASRLVPNLDTNALLAEVETTSSPLPSPQELLAKEPSKAEVSALLAEKEAEMAAERRRKKRDRMQQLMLTIQEYTAFIRQYPDKASLYHQRGVAYEMLKQHNEALDDFSHALRLDPGMLPAYLDRGSLYVANGDMEKALADYNEALHLKPQDADIYAVRAELLRKLGRYASAEADARKAITLDPGNRRYQRLLGRISKELTSY
jgi:tetratricopeptide (TPR) repeat protein